MDLTPFLSQLGIPANLTQDAALLIVVVAISLVLGLLIGRTKLIAILVSSYASYALLVNVPQGYLGDYTQRLFLFFALVLVLVLLGKNVFEVFISGRGYLWRVLVLSFLEVTMVLSIALTMAPPDEALAYVSFNAYSYLTLPVYHFVWLALPLVFVLLIQKKLHR